MPIRISAHALCIAAAVFQLLPSGSGVSRGTGSPMILQGPASEPKKRLWVCNAYTHSGTLDVVLDRTAESIGQLQYKDCHDFSLNLRNGDLLHFFIQGPKTPRLGIGGFMLSGLPNTMESPLLLTVQKHSGDSLRAIFQSHAFTNPTETAQVAVMDAYMGNADAEKALQIAEVMPADGARGAPAELQPVPQELLLNSVVSVNPGQYQVSLNGERGRAPSAKLVAESGVSYVVLRVGDNGTLPEEVVVFPQPKAMERSSFASLLASCVAWVRGLF